MKRHTSHRGLRRLSALLVAAFLFGLSAMALAQDQQASQSGDDDTTAVVQSDSTATPDDASGSGQTTTASNDTDRNATVLGGHYTSTMYRGHLLHR